MRGPRRKNIQRPNFKSERVQWLLQENFVSGLSRLDLFFSEHPNKASLLKSDDACFHLTQSHAHTLA